MKIERSWVALKATAMYYCLDDTGRLWEAWVWNGTDQAPTELYQEGYRWQQTGEAC